MVITGRIIESIANLALVLTIMEVTHVSVTLAMFLPKVTMICVTYKMSILKDEGLENASIEMNFPIIYAIQVYSALITIPGSNAAKDLSGLTG